VWPAAGGDLPVAVSWPPLTCTLRWFATRAGLQGLPADPGGRFRRWRAPVVGTAENTVKITYTKPRDVTITMP
jgi:hypothetical protein